MIRNYSKRIKLVAFFAGVLVCTGVQAGYYVRPIVQVNTAFIDGYTANGATAASQNYTSDFRSSIDLRDGTVKAYLNLQGPGGYAQTGGTFGDTITFSPNAIGTNAHVSFDFDGEIFADEWDSNLNSTMQVVVYSSLYVYQAGSGVTYANYGNVAYDSYKVVGRSRVLDFTNPEEGLNEFIQDQLFGSFTIGSSAYDIFAGLVIAGVTNSNPVHIEMDFLNTGTFGIETDPGVTFSSASGVLLTNDEGTINQVSEPATWALIISGLGLMMGGMYRRRTIRSTALA
jgi:hypothetical protein